MPKVSGGGIDPSGPRDPLNPLGPLKSQIQHFEAMFEVIFDDYEGFIDELYRNVQQMPPEQRFTESADEVKEMVQSQFGSIDALVSQFPFDEDTLNIFLKKAISSLIKQVLEGVYVVRNPEGHLIVAASLQAILNAVNRALHEDNYDGEVLSSAVLALYARFYNLVKYENGDVSEEAVVRDVARGLHYTHEAFGESYFRPHPDEIDFELLREEIVRYGAVSAYKHLDISVTRGAELANVSHNEFRELLDRHGVRPNLGPDSLEDLHESSLIDE